MIVPKSFSNQGCFALKFSPYTISYQIYELNFFLLTLYFDMLHSGLRMRLFPNISESAANKTTASASILFALIYAQITC